jgi:pimeloyl-ACP methyl ester carboxylesterase
MASAAHFMAQADPAWREQMRLLHDTTHGQDYWRRLLRPLQAVLDGQDDLPFGAADLATIAQPVLVVHGDRDPFFPVRVATTMYEAMPNAELAILPSVTHGAPSERPDLFVSILADFLLRHRDR